MESYLRVAKNLLWRQEELELMETRKRESTMPMVKGQGVPYKKVSMCMKHSSACCARHKYGELLKNAHRGRPKHSEEQPHGNGQGEF